MNFKLKMATQSKLIVNNTPISIYDNCGSTFDRFTIIVETPINHHGEIYNEVFGASENPFHPLGFGQYVGDYFPKNKFKGIQKGRHLGKKIKTIEEIKKEFPKLYKYLEQLTSE